MPKFIWRVARDGYRWTSGTYLATIDANKSIDANNWHYREYAPLDEFTGLFRTFAETPTTMEGVLEFANQYGHLGTGASGVGGDLDCDWEYWSDDEWRRADHTERDTPPNMEPIELWREEIDQMRECVEIWDEAQSGNADEQLMQSLQVTVCNSLRGRVKVIFARDRRVEGFILQIMPNALLGALWLQLAETISGSKKHRACAACGKWFEVSPEKFRRSRNYCSEPCRSRAYRSRKEEARKLANEGKTIKEIAARLGSDAKTIRGWLMAIP